jgi:hypothetical protein
MYGVVVGRLQHDGFDHIVYGGVLGLLLCCTSSWHTNYARVDIVESKGNGELWVRTRERDMGIAPHPGNPNRTVELGG